MTMNVHTDLPQVAALRLEVERRLGHSLTCRSDFAILVSEIERVTREHIAENTLRRIWGRMKSYDTVFGRTLDVLDGRSAGRGQVADRLAAGPSVRGGVRRRPYIQGRGDREFHDAARGYL